MEPPLSSPELGDINDLVGTAQDWLDLNFALLPDYLWEDRWKKRLRICGPKDWTRAYRTVKDWGLVRVTTDRSAALVLEGPERYVTQSESSTLLQTGKTRHQYRLPERDLTHLYMRADLAALRGEDLSVVLLYSEPSAVYFFGGFRYTSRAVA